MKTATFVRTTLVTALLAVSSFGALAKSPNSNGVGSGPSHTPGIPQGQGAGSSSTSTTPPGWSSDGKRQGWDSSGGTPPGWTNNDGQKKGWDGASSAPGIEKR
jgi:hypothetical protein